MFEFLENLKKLFARLTGPSTATPEAAPRPESSGPGFFAKLFESFAKLGEAQTRAAAGVAESVQNYPSPTGVVPADVVKPRVDLSFWGAHHRARAISLPVPKTK
jgi:hypothetical protein